MKNIYWYHPDKVSKDFQDPTHNPSFRLRCWYNHKHLLGKNIKSFIVDNIKKMNDPSTIVLMSFGEKEYEIAQWAKEKNATLIHDYTENIRGIPILEKTKELCDYIVCSSTLLYALELINYPTKARLIKDPVEPFPIIKQHHKTDKIKVVWCGMGGNAYIPREFVKPIIEELDMEYIEISNNEDASIKWDIDSWYLNMAKCDIAICPQDHWNFPAKSNIKAITAMALGLPVVASPLPSYMEVLDSGQTGHISYSLDDWRASLGALRALDERKRYSKNALKKLDGYQLNHITQQWEDILVKSY